MKESIKKFYRNHVNNTGVYDVFLNKENSPKHRALLIYTNHAIKFYLRNKHLGTSTFKSHSGFIETVELLKTLNNHLFKVDILNYDEKYYIDYNKYDVVIDIADNLKSITTKNALKVFYATSCHWFFFQESMIQRIKAFNSREGVLLATDRPIQAYTNEKYSDVITVFGNEKQQSTFFQPTEKFTHLNISVNHEPLNYKYFKRDRNKFVWFGGHGAFHKGLDLVVSVFEKLSDRQLIVIGNVESNVEFLNWFNDKLKKNKNIHYHGWLTPDKEEFQNLIKDCVAQIFPSSSEGGAGSVCQLMHFGVIPIVTDSCCLKDADQYARVINASSVEEIINEIEKNILEISNLTDKQIEEMSLICYNYANANFTLDKYKESINAFVSSLKHKL
jgi:glycosyltransferase involved in cell wall biosynthesis